MTAYRGIISWQDNAVATLIIFRLLLLVMVTLADVKTAKRRIDAYIIKTPVVYSPSLSKLTGARVYLKLENLQIAGSFKVRGAANKIQKMRESLPKKGVIAASAGNHAQGVVVAAHAAGVPATVVMPEWSSVSKQEATRRYGADVVVHGKTISESIGYAEKLAGEGRLFIHPYDDEDVIAGQGTIALEILADLPETDQIIVPVGGGGLIAGIAAAAKTLCPALSVVGAQAVTCPSAVEAKNAGAPVSVPACGTLADGIRVSRIGERTFPLICRYVDRIVTATDDEIADAMLLLLERKHIVAEGAGAIPLAVLMNGSAGVLPGSTVVLVISGGNVDSPLLFRVVRHALARKGRIMSFSVMLEDQPGSLAGLTAVIAEKKGNVLDIRPMQAGAGSPVHAVRVYLEVETRGSEHAAEVQTALADAGYALRPE